jgi:hypothetical protein
MALRLMNRIVVHRLPIGMMMSICVWLPFYHLSVLEKTYHGFVDNTCVCRQQQCTLRMAAQVNHLQEEEEEDNDHHHDDTENQDDPQLAVVHGSKNKAANTTTTTKDTTNSSNNSSLTILCNIEQILVLSDLHTNHVDSFK